MLGEGQDGKPGTSHLSECAASWDRSNQ
jgi:hypothetical protein